MDRRGDRPERDAPLPDGVSVAARSAVGASPNFEPAQVQIPGRPVIESTQHPSGVVTMRQPERGNAFKTSLRAGYHARGGLPVRKNEPDVCDWGH
ncbi:MAG: hypothetical protein QOF70_6942 [Acetobacteraceae bacterium]|jgi:hypothetical protein|nr:hypothetical protein [Acetobacteraceae bacterium]